MEFGQVIVGGGHATMMDLFALEARIDQRIEAVGHRIDAVGLRLDAFIERMDERAAADREADAKRNRCEEEARARYERQEKKTRYEREQWERQARESRERWEQQACKDRELAQTAHREAQAARESAQAERDKRLDLCAANLTETARRIEATVMETANIKRTFFWGVVAQWASVGGIVVASYYANQAMVVSIVQALRTNSPVG
jgi:hypothetical protein